MKDDYKNLKIVLRAIGIPLLIIGIIFVIIGFTSFSSSGFMLFGLGGFLTVIGFGLVSFSIVRPMSKYYATEASPAIEIAGESIGEGLKKSGFNTAQEQKQIIKVKCPHCGYLESEDAEFCSKCGKKI